MNRRPSLFLLCGGVQQKNFPPHHASFTRGGFLPPFRLALPICCDSMPIKNAIESYGIDGSRVLAVQPFSRQNLDCKPVQLPNEIESFLNSHTPAFFSYVSYRPEYRLPVLRQAMCKFREAYPEAGCIWLGFPSKEMADARAYVAGWPDDERKALLLLGNLDHDAFLTL